MGLWPSTRLRLANINRGSIKEEIRVVPRSDRSAGQLKAQANKIRRTAIAEVGVRMQARESKACKEVLPESHWCTLRQGQDRQTILQEVYTHRGRSPPLGVDHTGEGNDRIREGHQDRPPQVNMIPISFNIIHLPHFLTLLPTIISYVIINI